MCIMQMYKNEKMCIKTYNNEKICIYSDFVCTMRNIRDPIFDKLLTKKYTLQFV